jgi:hypothetical protein
MLIKTSIALGITVGLYSDAVAVVYDNKVLRMALSS